MPQNAKRNRNNHHNQTTSQTKRKGAKGRRKGNETTAQRVPFLQLQLHFKVVLFKTCCLYIYSLEVSRLKDTNSKKRLINLNWQRRTHRLRSLIAVGEIMGQPMAVSRPGLLSLTVLCPASVLVKRMVLGEKVIKFHALLCEICKTEKLEKMQNANHIYLC